MATQDVDLDTFHFQFRISAPLVLSNGLVFLLFHKITIAPSSAYRYFREQLVVVREGGEVRTWGIEVVESQRSI